MTSTGTRPMPDVAHFLAAVPRAQALGTGISTWRPRLNRRHANVGFVVGKMALGQVFLSRTLVLPCQYHFSNSSIFIYYRAAKS